MARYTKIRTVVLEDLEGDQYTVVVNPIGEYLLLEYRGTHDIQLGERELLHLLSLVRGEVKA